MSDDKMLACAIAALNKEREASLHHYTLCNQYLQVIQTQDRTIAALKTTIETAEKLLKIKNESLPEGDSVHRTTEPSTV